MLKKTCRTQFFGDFGCFDNSLITNILQLKLPFTLPNATQNPHNFQFLFRHTFQTTNYTLLNISTELHCLFSRFLMPFQKIYAENFSKLLSF